MPVQATRASDCAADPALLHDWLMLGSITLDGLPKNVRVARRFVVRTVGDHPRADAALLLTSELVTNAVQHSRSQGRSRAVVVVAVRSRAGLLITVTDHGSDSTVPVVRNDPESERGNGLLLVSSLADAWGCLHGETTTTVWFSLCSNSPGIGLSFIG